MVRGAKEKLLRSNTPKVTKLEGKGEELLRSREEQGGAEEIDEKLSKTTNSETHFRPNNIIIEFSLMTATFWIPHT